MIREEPELGGEKSGCCTCFSVLGRRARRKPAVGVGEGAWDGRGGDGGEVCMCLCMDGRERVAGCCTSELRAEAKTQEWRPNP